MYGIRVKYSTFWGASPFTLPRACPGRVWLTTMKMAKMTGTPYHINSTLIQKSISAAPPSLSLSLSLSLKVKNVHTHVS